MVPQPSVNRKARALSVQLSPVNKKSGLAEASAALALKRAIQSSPVRLVGTQSAPIDVEELTPKPTRRVLFPSPGNSDTSKAAGLGRMPAANGSESGQSTPRKKLDPIAADPDDKENCPPPPEDEDHFLVDRLFQEHPESLARPTTPTPSGKLPYGSMLKTPNNNGTPNRLPPTTGDFFSSTAKALLQHPRTPKRSATISGTLTARRPISTSRHYPHYEIHLAAPATTLASPTSIHRTSSAPMHPCQVARLSGLGFMKILSTMKLVHCLATTKLQMAQRLWTWMRNRTLRKHPKRRVW